MHRSSYICVIMDVPVSAIIYYHATLDNKCTSSYEVTSKNKEIKTTYYKDE
jgi:hypothetical protein